MLFSKSSLFAIAAAVGLVSAQTSYPETPAGSVKTHVVMVSNKTGSLTFIPEEVTAVPGDLVQFHFYPKVCNLLHQTMQGDNKLMRSRWFRITPLHNRASPTLARHSQKPMALRDSGPVLCPLLLPTQLLVANFKSQYRTCQD